MIAIVVVIKGEAVAVVFETPGMVEDSFNATIMIDRITYLIVVVVVGSTDNQKVVSTTIATISTALATSSPIVYILWVDLDRIFYLYFVLAGNHIATQSSLSNSDA